MKLNEVCQKKQNIVLLIPKQRYPSMISTIVRQTAESFEKVLGVNTNRPCKSFYAEIQKANLSLDNFFCLDCVTKTVATAPDLVESMGLKKSEENKLLYASSPSALTEISMVIFRLLDENLVDTIFFDSLSTLLVYSDEMTAVKFVHHLMNKARHSEKTAIFTCLKEDIDTTLVKDISLFADKIVDLTRADLT